MKIRKVHIQNFRNLKDVCIYPSKTTVIVGENNAGKSNFIHALRLILDPQAERLRLDLTEADITDSSRIAGEDSFSITIEVGDLQKHVDMEAIFRDRISQVEGTNETYITIQGKFEKDPEGYYSFGVNLMSPTFRFNNPMKMTPRMYKSLPLFFLDAIRDAERETRATGRNLLAQILDEVDFSDVQGDIQTALKEANRALSSGEQVMELTDGITAQFTQLTTGGQSQIKLSVSDEDPLNIRKNFRVGYQKSPANAPTDLTRHGTGLQNLALIAIFRHRIKSSRTGTPILAIEEPEAHLHPHAQRRLFRDLDETNAPVFITTHSPALVKYANPRGLILLRSNNDFTSSFQLDSNHLDASDLRNLEQLMRGGRAELFFARSIILVEGQSELSAFPTFAEILGCDLDRDGISLVEAGGNSFAFILKSCREQNFSIPTVVVYDVDALSTDERLLKDALEVGLIDINTRRRVDSVSLDQKPLIRKSILDQIGWFGAEECFEEEICKYGYFDTVVNFIRTVNPDTGRAFESYHQNNNLEISPKSIVKFIKGDSRNKWLKVEIAKVIANSAIQVQCVPLVFANAIRKSILLSQQGIIVDENFESRAWSAGFKNILLEFLMEKGLYNEFLGFCEESSNGLRKQLQYQSFLNIYLPTPENRHELRIRVANAVHECGCNEYAIEIRNSIGPAVI